VPNIHRRKGSDVSVGDIQLQRTQKIDEFLSTKQLALNNQPTTLVDIFEYINWTDSEVQCDTSSSLGWHFCSFFQMSDLLNLRQLCKSASNTVTNPVQLLAIMLGNIGDLRVTFW